MIILLCSFYCVTSPQVNVCLPANCNWPVGYIDTSVDCSYFFIRQDTGRGIFCCPLCLFGVYCGMLWKVSFTIFIVIYLAQLNQNSRFFNFYCHWLKHVVFNYIHMGFVFALKWYLNFYNIRSIFRMQALFLSNLFFQGHNTYIYIYIYIYQRLKKWY